MDEGFFCKLPINLGIVFVNDSFLWKIENLEKGKQNMQNSNNYDRIFHEYSMTIKFTCQDDRISPVAVIEISRPGLPHSKACRKRHLKDISYKSHYALVRHLVVDGCLFR